MSAGGEPADLILNHALAVTLDARRRILTDASVVVRGDRIAAVGKTADLAPRYAAARTIDATDKVVLPGLVDAHLHTNEGPRGFVPDDVPAVPWVRDWIRPIFAALTPEEEYLLSLLVLSEALKTGTTTFCEGGSIKYPASLARAVEEVGIRGNIGRWTWDAVTEPRAFYQPAEQALRTYDELIDTYHGAAGGRLSMWVHLTGVGTATDELLVGAKRLADARGVGLSMHQSQHEDEVDAFVAQHGRRPMEHFAQLGILDRNTRFVHMLALDEREIALIERHDVKLVHCVMTAMKLGYGATATGRMPEMLAQGIPVALGCDGANCSNTFDLFRAMFCVAGVYKDNRRDVRLVPAETALEMATVNGARSLLMEDQIGSLEPGKKADLVVCDRKRAEWLPTVNVVNNLVYSADGRSVDMVIVDGRVVVEGGRVTTIDEQALYAQIDAIDWAARLHERTGLPLRTRWPVE